ncbi:MAG: tRNA (guanosine(46)-N7)-methyltransferase TrmB [Cyanobacteriota bacterium]|nr:tRNA (guanosine(46)-N7)-methyltransferase TrmB [Cyanobacteriota bacterium]
MTVVRVRHHVNPLAEKYQEPVTVPDWRSIYPDPDRPLHVDIGCAKGVFLLQMAELEPAWNFLGLEIRRPLVLQAQHRQRQAGLTNLHVMFANANVSFRTLITQGEGCPPLQRVSIQFPDPWFKLRHHKRRVLQPQLVADLAAVLPVGGEVIIQSDVEAVALDMVDRLASAVVFCQDPPGWLDRSPFPAQTDRERVTLAQGLPVYRARFVKTASVDP